MSGALDHSPAKIIQQLLVNLSQGTLPSTSGTWPVYATREANSPDNAITVYDTTGTLDGRRMTDGEYIEHHGFQVRVRSVSHEAGYAKANDIAMALAKSVSYNNVTVDAKVYLVYAISWINGPLTLGKEPVSDRSLFTINFKAALRQTT